MLDADFLHMNICCSLADPDDTHTQYIQKHWTCALCGKEMVATVLDQIRHKEKCDGKKGKISILYLN